MTATRLAISFDLTAQTRDYQDEAFENSPVQPYLHIDAWPLADGHSLLTSRSGYVFDLLAVLSHGLEASELDVFTCSCGVAGCAGIHETVQLQVDENEVRWVFPEEPFRVGFNTDLIASGEPLVLCFDRAQYEEALADAKRRLLGLSEGTGLPAAIPPFAYPDLETPLRQTIEEAWDYTQNRIEEERHRAVIFGNLLDAEIKVSFPNGAVYRLIVPHLAYTVSEKVAEARGLDDYDDVLEEETLPAFHANHDGMVAAARALTWEEVHHFVWPDSRIVQTVWLPAEPEEQVKQWAGAVLELQLPQ